MYRQKRYNCIDDDLLILKSKTALDGESLGVEERETRMDGGHFDQASRSVQVT
jgi:hypothetical protein